MKFKLITPQDVEYVKELMLRWEVLSKPLGMPPPEKEITKEEAESIHLIALEKKAVVGCVLFFPENDLSGKLYQMAISEEYQGQGFGRQLLAHLEHTLSRKGFKEVHLYASQDNVGFYKQMGYHLLGDPVEKLGYTVQLMSKTLKNEEDQNAAAS